MENKIMQPRKDAWASTAAEKKTTQRDFYSQLNICTWLSRVTGTFPLKLEGHIGKRQYTVSSGLMLYDTILLIVTVICIKIWSSEFLVLNPSNTSPTVFYTILQSSGILTVIVVFVSGIFGRNKLETSLLNMNLQDASLKELSGQPDYTANIKRNHIRTGLFLIISLLLCIFDFIRQMDFSKRFLLHWIARAYPFWTLKINVCLFIDIVFILRERLEILNEQLIRMVEDLKNGTVETVYKQQNFREKIRKIAIIRGVLCDAALNINQAFGINIVLRVTSTLLLLTYAAYYLIQYLGPNGSYLNILRSLNIGIIVSMDVFYLIWACNLAEHEACLTGKIIHKLTICEIDTPLLNNVIQGFSLQLQHEKLEFSGSGLFRLNPSFIPSIAGAMMTYLVVLIQNRGPQVNEYPYSGNVSHVV